MGFYSAHIAISNKHILVFVSVAPAQEEELVHMRFPTYGLVVHISSQQSTQSYLCSSSKATSIFIPDAATCRCLLA